MARIHFKFLRSTNSLIALLISLLGFSSACKEDQGREYGSPHADFLLKGKVSSAMNTQQAIPDVKLEMYPVNGSLNLTVEQLVGSARSDLHGNYMLINYGFDFQGDHSYRVKITDVDGELNGEYQSLDTTVVMQNTKFINGDGSWYRGIAETELYVHLKPKD